MTITRLLVRTAALVALVALFLPATPAQADNKRRELYKTYDYNDDGRIKCKEAKNFRKEKEIPFQKLMDFCEVATEKPKKHGVKLDDPDKPKKNKCKKKRIDAPYMKAWIKDGSGGGDKKKKDDPMPVHP